MGLSYFKIYSRRFDLQFSALDCVSKWQHESPRSHSRRRERAEKGWENPGSVVSYFHILTPSAGRDDVLYIRRPCVCVYIYIAQRRRAKDFRSNHASTSSHVGVVIFTYVLHICITLSAEFLSQIYTLADCGIAFCRCHDLHYHFITTYVIQLKRTGPGSRA